MEYNIGIKVFVKYIYIQSYIRKGKYCPATTATTLTTTAAAAPSH